MSDITTIGRWVRLPTALGADDRLRADQPLGAGTLQIIGSNATLACRENNLRTLWERGPVDVWADLPISDFPESFNWSGLAADGVLAQFAGIHRVRRHGETATFPGLRLTVRATAPSGEIVGVVLLVAPAHGDPAMVAGHYATATTTSTSVVTLSLDIGLTPELVGALSVSPATFAGLVPEAGEHPAFAAYVGAWCTSNSSMVKASLGAMTLYLMEPVT